MKYRILFILLIGLGLRQQINAQQEQSLFFMHDLFYSHYTNPAFLPQRTVFVNAIPSNLYFNLSNTGFSFNSIFTERNDSLYLDPQRFLSSLQENNYFQVNAEYDPISFSFRIRKLFFSVGYRFRYSIFINYPKSLFELGWQGNGAFVDQTVDIAPDFQMTAFHELAIGGGYHINKNLTVGARLKVLMGVFDISTSAASATLYTDPEAYQLQLATDYRINVSSVPVPQGLSLHPDSSDLSSFDVNFFPSTANLLSSNIGFALDLGATYQFGDKWRVAASITDLGSIRWNRSVSNLHSNGDFLFEGLDIAGVLLNDTVEFAAILDTLQERFKFEQTNENYTTGTPAKLYIGGEFRPVHHLILGGLVYTEFYKGQVFPAFSISARKMFGKIFSVGMVYGIRNRRFDNLGVNLVLSLGGFQTFIVSDNIIPIFDPFSARNTNLRFGMTLSFGKHSPVDDEGFIE